MHCLHRFGKISSPLIESSTHLDILQNHLLIAYAWNEVADKETIDRQQSEINPYPDLPYTLDHHLLLLHVSIPFCSVTLLLLCCFWCGCRTSVAAVVIESRDKRTKLFFSFHKTYKSTTDRSIHCTPPCRSRIPLLALVAVIAASLILPPFIIVIISCKRHSPCILKSFTLLNL